MTDQRRPIFAECQPCGERWKVATTSMPIVALARAFKVATCPNCGERRKVVLCATDGSDAVTAARDGAVPAPAAEGGRR